MKTQPARCSRRRDAFLLYPFWFLLLFCVLPSPAFSQRNGRATVEGVVIETDSKPVAGAKVVLQTSDGKKPRAVKTDAQGHFLFRSIRHGMYDIRASVKGRSSEWMHNVACKPGTIVTVTLVLPEKSGDK